MRTALVILFCFSFHLQIAQPLKVVKTECEHKNNPLGIDTEVPRFSWQMQAIDNKQGYKQTAFQLLVTDEGSPPDG